MAVTNASLHEWDLRCMSTDPNPVDTENFPDGISLFEKDTFKVFFFDARRFRIKPTGPNVGYAIYR